MTPAVATLLFVAHLAGPPRAARPDSTPATLFTRDSALRVVLTGDTLEFGFTPRGAANVRRRIDSAASARPARGASAGWFDVAALTRSIGEGVTRGVHMKFAAADVREVRAEGDMLTLCFAAHTSGATACGKGNHFQFTATSAADVQRFAAALEQARARAARAR